MRRGQTLLELALALAFLLLVLAGLTDYGRALTVKIALTNAAREGAHYAAANPTDSAGIRQRVRQEAANAGVTLLDDSDIAITGSPSQGQPITVTVQTRVPTVMAGFIGMNELVVQAQATAPVLRR